MLWFVVFVTTICYDSMYYTYTAALEPVVGGSCKLMTSFTTATAMSSGKLAAVFVFNNGSVIMHNGTEYVYYNDQQPDPTINNVAVGGEISVYTDTSDSGE